MAADPLSFTSATYSVGAGPFAVAVGDLNSDGKPDIVVTNQHSNSISILLNNGDGSFQLSQTITVGVTPEGVAVGDFNGDGKPDIVVTNYNSNTISVLLNNGTGSFQLSQTVTVNGGPAAVAVGDFNGDGKFDLVTANYNNSTISILLNNGTGSFQVSQTISVGATPVSVAVGDFNNDGKPDLAVANFNANSISILLNNGTGSFQISQTIPVGATPSSVAVGDFNGDGKLDLAVTNRANNALSILLNNGAGSFSQPQTYPVGAGPNAVAVGDFNSDGILDLVTANVTANTVSILLNNGNGTFQSAQNFSVGTSPNAVAIGDFNGDGELDLVTANNGSNNVSVLLQTLLRVQVNNISATANTPFTGSVATISGANMASDTTATIDWGDGSVPTAGTISGSGSTLTVSGTHTYTTPGTFPLTVTAIEGARSAQGTGQATVVQGPLTVQVNSISATANTPFTGPVATISGANMASDTTATINWGDCSPTTPGTVSGSGSTLTVSGSHTYTQPGTFTLTVSATEGNRMAQGTGQATVQPPLVVLVDKIQPTATVPFSGPVAIISGANMTSDTTATIIWGDGSSTPGTVVDNLNGTFTVNGTHTYATAGSFTLTVSAKEGTRNAQNSVQITVQPPLIVQVNNIQASANVPFTGPVATISNANMASDTTATINWGDGSPSTTGTISVSGSTLTVNGTHIYTEGGTFTLTVSAAEGTRSAQGTGQALVLAVLVDTIQPVASMPFSGPVAIIIGANSVNDTATINWGDGSPNIPGTVVVNPDGTLTVSGTHTYSHGGTFPLTVSATEGARSTQNTGQAIVKTASLHARAFGLQSTNPDNGPFGDASIPSTGGNQSVTVDSALIPALGIVVSGIADTVSGSLTPPPPRADASSMITSMSGQGITALVINVTAHADLSTAIGSLSGQTTFNTLIINGTVYPTNFAPAPNTVVSLPGVGTVTLNEQTVVQQANQISMQVNGMHIRITQGPNAGADVLVGHAETAINLV
ncbi:MAG TPA: choice-of-anchor P family protein [Ktedonobacteraceae bacterium]|nr:choice-of-anchor P family protein [Ktedonobacteraceae bacterium]